MFIRRLGGLRLRRRSGVPTESRGHLLDLVWTGHLDKLQTGRIRFGKFHFLSCRKGTLLEISSMQAWYLDLPHNNIANARPPLPRLLSLPVLLSEFSPASPNIHFFQFDPTSLVPEFVNNDKENEHR